MAGLWRVALAITIVLIPASALAQDQVPVAELFTGYSFQTVRIPGSVHFVLPSLTPAYTEPRHDGSHGWGFSANWNLTRQLGVKAAASGAYGNKVVEPIRIIFDQNGGVAERRSVSRYQFLFGPQFSLRTGRVTQFVHTLAGFQHYRLEGYDSETGFAMGFGGGVDVKIRDRLAIRAFEADYVPAQEGSLWRHHVRLGAGIVFHFGGH